MKYYWLIFGVLWIVFNFKTINHIQERLTDIANLADKKNSKIQFKNF